MNDSFDARKIRIKPYYIFSAISLALVILLLAILFPRKSLHIAEVQLSVQTPAGRLIPAADLTAMVREFTTEPQHVQRAVANLAPELKSSLGVDGGSVELLGQLVAKQLEFQISDDSSLPQQLTIRYGNPSRTTAINVLAGVAHYFASSFPELARGNRTAAGARVYELKERIADVREQRQQLVEVQIARQQEARRGQLSADSRPSRGDNTAGPNDEPLAAILGDRRPEPAESHEPSDEAAVAGLHHPVASTRPLSVPPVDASPAADDDLSTQTDPQSSSFVSTTDAVPIRRSPTEEGVESGMLQLADSARLPTENVASPPAAEPKRGGLTAVHEPEFPTGPEVADTASSSNFPARSWESAATADAGPLTPPRSSIEHKARLPQLVEPNPKWTQLSEEIAGLRAELDEMLKIYTPKHPMADDTLRRIEEVETELARTPRFIEIVPPASSTYQRPLEPIPSLSPLPAVEDQAEVPADSASVPPTIDLHADNRRHRAQATEEAVKTAEYGKLTAELEQLESELAAAIHQDQLQSDAVRHASMVIRGEPQTTLVRTGRLSLFDIVTYLLPACVVGLAASVIRRPVQPPLELYSLSDAEGAMGLRIVGAISTTDGPDIPAPEGGGPPDSVVRLVFASEVLLVATAVVLVIACFQIPDLAAEVRRNPISALVMSIDYSLDFVRGFF